MRLRISSLNLLGAGAVGKRGEPARLAELDRLVARDGGADERLVGLGHGLHLGLDLLEIGGRDAVRQIDVVIEAVLDRRTGGELGLGPDFQQSGRQHVGGGMADAFEVGHEGESILRESARLINRDAVPVIPGSDSSSRPS